MQDRVPSGAGIETVSGDVAGLPEAVPSSPVEVEPGGSFELRIHHVAKRIADGVFRMLAYNGSIPGPTLRVPQGSGIVVEVVNETDMATTVHWHGLRLENRYDGVPHDTQAPIPPGGRYAHWLTFPDAGTYWYHPHVREHYAQEMGLYGNVVVEPRDPTYWPGADRDVFLTLDDILIEDGRIAPFDPRGPDFAAMGRFGNVLLTGGETLRRLEVRRREVVRLHLTNTANTRVFRVRLPGARLKLVGGDGGRYEREQWVDDVVVAPSERAIVDVAFDRPGAFALEHSTPARSYPLAAITVVDPAVETLNDFDTLRVSPEMVAERERAAAYLDAPPDRTLALVAEMGSGEHAHHETRAPHDHGAALADGIEWEDLMPEVNRASTRATMTWKIVDRDTGKENADIDWTFRAGERVKVRIVNEMESDHPMHHPFHVHGERFLVLARDGRPEGNLVWKDTVLVRTGEVVDILVDMSNPGLWMAHCHIPEHMGTGMMFDFRVAPA